MIHGAWGFTREKTEAIPLPANTERPGERECSSGAAESARDYSFLLTARRLSRMIS